MTRLASDSSVLKDSPIEAGFDASIELRISPRASLAPKIMDWIKTRDLKALQAWDRQAEPGALARVANGNFVTPLMAAVQGQWLKGSQILLRHCAVDATDEDRRTALIIAAEEGFANGVLALLAAGANPDASSDTFGTALMHAVRRHHNDCVVILAGCADLENKEGRKGTTALMRAAESHNAFAVPLVGTPAAAAATNTVGRTALFMGLGRACAGLEKDKNDTLDALLKVCDVNATDHQGRTALGYACLKEDKEAALRLIGARDFVGRSAGLAREIDDAASIESPSTAEEVINALGGELARQGVSMCFGEVLCQGDDPKDWQGSWAALDASRQWLGKPAREKALAAGGAGHLPKMHAEWEREELLAATLSAGENSQRRDGAQEARKKMPSSRL